MNRSPNPEQVDEENPEWTTTMLNESSNAAKLFPHLLQSEKVKLTIEYDADIISAFRATGQHWQTRMNDALREWLREHRLKTR